MPEAWWDLIPFVLAAAAAGVLGGIIPSLWPPSERIRGYVQHFAAGLLLAVIAVDLLPEIRELERPAAMVAGLLLGAAAMVALKQASRRLERRRQHDLPTGLVAAAAVDTAIDGALIGAAFAVDPQLGLLLALGLGTELFALMLSVAAEFARGGHGEGGRLRAIGCTSIISVMLVLGATLGVLLMAGRPPVVHALALSFAASALIYLVTEELLARGRDARDSIGTAAAFFAGFILLAAYTSWTGT